MNKLMWKMYLNNIIDANTNIPQPFPEIHTTNTYSFKFNKTYFKSLTISPQIGLTPHPYHDFFSEYRITALNIIVYNGEFSQTDTPGFQFNNSYFKDINSFTLTYWPEFPKLKPIQTPQYYWNINAETIKVVIHYEVVPLFPNFTIPSNSKYWKLDDFHIAYKEMEKPIVNCKIKIENDILNGEINPPTSDIIEFFRYLENI